MPRIAITSPSSLVASKLARRLLRRGESVHVLCRSVSRAESLIERGVRAAHGDLRQQRAVRELLADADTVFVVTPSAGDDGDAYELTIAGVLAEVIPETPVSHVVYLSALGAHAPGSIAHLHAKHEIERLLAGTGVDLTILRPGVMLDFLRLQRRALERGVLALPIEGGRPFPVVAADDVAQAALDAIIHHQSGHATYELVGPGAGTPQQVAESLSRHWDRPIRERQLGGAAYVEHLHDLGVSERRARVLTRLLSDYDQHDIPFDPGSWCQVRDRLNVCETTLDSFASELAHSSRLPSAEHDVVAHGVSTLVKTLVPEPASSELWIA